LEKYTYLDVRSGRVNSAGTGLGIRTVSWHDGIYRDLEVSEEREHLWIAVGDGKVGGELSLDISNDYVREEGGYRYWIFRGEVEVVEALEEGIAVVLERVSELVWRYEGVLDRLIVRHVMSFYWTSNVSGRDRIGSWNGESWSLLNGGLVRGIGFVGESGIVVGNGSVRIGLDYGEELDEYSVGNGLALTEGALSDYVFGVGEVGVLSKESRELRLKEGVFEEGLTVFFSSYDLESATASEVEDGDFLSGRVLEEERVLFRLGYGGDLIISEVVNTEQDFGVGSLQVARSSGKVHWSGGGILLYEGLILGKRGHFDAVDLVAGVIPEKSGLGVSGLTRRVDGLLLERPECSWILSTDGRVLPCVLVKSFPRRLDPNIGYVRESDFSVRVFDGVGLKFVESQVGLVGWDGVWTTGVTLGLTSSTVGGFIERSSESLGSVSEGSLYFFFSGQNIRKDFGHLGHASFRYFKIGDEILTEGQDFDYLLKDSKLEWIANKATTLTVDVPTSEVFLENGVKRISSVELKRDTDNGFLSEDLVEGVDYLATSTGLILAQKVSSEKVRGVGFTRVGDLIEGIYGEVGDWIVFSDGVYRKIISIQGESYTLSSLSGLPSVGSWTVYQGYSSVSDLSLLSAESFKEVQVTAHPALEVFIVNTASSAQESLQLTLSRRDGSSIFALTTEGQVLGVNLLLPEVITRLDLSDAHVIASSYRLKVGDEDGLAEGVDFNVDADGVVTFTNQNVDVTRDIILKRVPMVTGSVVEIDLDGQSSTPLGAVISLYMFKEEDIRFERKSGAVSLLSKSLLRGQGIRCRYTPEGESRTLETLGFTVVRESAERVDSRTYTFNALGSVLYEGVEPVVYVGSSELGYGTTPLPFIVDDTINLPITAEDSSTEVYISYVVESARGGERAFTLSSSMEEFTLQVEAGATSLEILNTQSGVSVGDVLRVAGQIFSVKSVDGRSIGLDHPCRYTVSGALEKVTKQSDYFITLSGARFSASSGSNLFMFAGSLSRHLREKVLLVVGSEIHSVSSVEEKEGFTRVRVEGVTSGFDATTADILVSIRPVLTEGDSSVPLLSSVIIDQGFDLIRHENGLGYKLNSPRDYQIGEGAITLTGYTVTEGVEYYLIHTALGHTQPVALADGTISNPKLNISYTISNGEKESHRGEDVIFKGLVENRDTFYLRRISDSALSTEFSTVLKRRETSESGRGQGNGLVAVIEGGHSFDYYDRLAEDVVARARLSFYNSLTVSLENILSTMTGIFVGDQDGTFKFDLRTSSSLVSGTEDIITREIQPRYPALLVTGLSIDSELSPSYKLSDLLSAQESAMMNEMDDYLVSRISSKVQFSIVPPFRETVRDMVFEQAINPSPSARLFPERVGHFESVYGDSSDPDQYGSSVAQLSNGSIGDLSLVSSATLSERIFRFRVFDYSDKGFAQYPATAGKQSLILSAVPFKDFPLDSEGQPVLGDFISQGGTVPDILSGNADLALGGLSVGQPVALGDPERGISTITDDGYTSLLGELSASRVVRVREVINPFVITLGTRSELEVWSVLNSPKAFSADLSISRGDTILQSLSADLDESPSLKTYRAGVDLGLTHKKGELTNIASPFPFNLISPSQSFPEQGSLLEGSASITYTDLNPFEYPALRGEQYDDNGDESIPYLKRSSERDLLPFLSNPIRDMLSEQTNGQYVYPDEVRGVADIQDGKLTLDQSLTPFTDGDIASVDVQTGDLILVELDESGNAGSASTGFSEIGLIDGQDIYETVFNSEYSAGGLVRYHMENAYVERDESIGVYVEETPSGAQTLTSIVFDSNNNINASALGNAIYNANENILNGISLFLMSRGNVLIDAEVLTLTVSANSIDWNIQHGGSSTTPVSVTFQNGRIDILTNGSWFNFNAPNLSLNSPAETLTHPYRVNALFLNGGSSTASISSDRVQFSESYNFKIEAEGSDFECQLRTTTLDLTVYDQSDLLVSTVVSTDVNHVDQINGGADFTFTESQTGTTIKLPSYSHQNARSTRLDLRASVLCGSEVDSASLIFRSQDAYMDGTVFTPQNVASGSLSQIEIGDLLQVSGQGHMAGTYRVSNVYEGVPNQTLTGETGESNLGEEMVFPKIVDYTIDPNNNSVVIKVEGMLDNTLFTGNGPVGLVISPDGVNTEPAGSDSIVYAFYGSITTDGSFHYINDLGNQNFQGHPYVNARYANINLNKLETLLDDAILNEGYVTGQNRIPTPAFLDGNRNNLSYLFRDVGNGLVLEVTTSTAHEGLHNPYYIPITSLEYSDGGISHINLDYENLPEVDGPTHFHVPILKSDSIALTIRVPQGIHIDFDFPLTRQQNNGTDPNYFNSAQAYGLPDIGSFTFDPPLTFTPTDIYDVRVKRVRRFSNILRRLLRSSEDIPLLYDERYGEIDSLVEINGQYVLTPTLVDSKQTNVGSLERAVSVGDLIEVYDQETVGGVFMVSEVGQALTLSLLEEIDLSFDQSFRVTVRQKTIPELQSLNEFMRASTEVIMLSSTGRVEEVNVLKDSVESYGDVLVGDYLIVDPQGNLEGINGPSLERGESPQGDTGHVGHPSYVAGDPSELDDNRGVYRVTEKADDSLTVTPVFGTRSYDSSGVNILPTVNGSDGGDLRVTQVSDPNNSFLGNLDSIEPFIYRVARARSGVNLDLLETILFLRERTLSWSEMVRGIGGVEPYTWDQYVERDYVAFIGREDPTHPSNQSLLEIEGNPDVQPLLSNRKSLSLVDRRWFIEDANLSSEGYGDPTGEVAPSLIELFMSESRLRESRYSWIKIRGNRRTGTLVRFNQAEFSQPNTEASDDLDS